MSPRVGTHPCLGAGAVRKTCRRCLAGDVAGYFLDSPCLRVAVCTDTRLSLGVTFPEETSCCENTDACCLLTEILECPVGGGPAAVTVLWGTWADTPQKRPKCSLLLEHQVPALGAGGEGPLPVSLSKLPGPRAGRRQVAAGPGARMVPPKPLRLASSCRQEPTSRRAWGPRFCTSVQGVSYCSERKGVHLLLP